MTNKILTARYNELVTAALAAGYTTLNVCGHTRHLKLRTATFTAPHSGNEAVTALEMILAPRITDDQSVIAAVLGC